MEPLFGTPHPPTLSYFIYRADGSFVPLVPADELPYNVRLVGVPRKLQKDQILGMNCVSHEPSASRTFKLESALATPASLGQGQMHNRDSPLSGSTAVPAQPQWPTVVSHKPQNQPTSIQDHPIIQHANSADWRSKPPPNDPRANMDPPRGPSAQMQSTERFLCPVSQDASIHLPNQKVVKPDKKIWCNYWIRTGECDYTQQGCRYKHEMPDLETLNKIGFREVPSWWRETRPRVRPASRGDAVAKIWEPISPERPNEHIQAERSRMLPWHSQEPSPSESSSEAECSEAELSDSQQPARMEKEKERFPAGTTRLKARQDKQGVTSIAKDSYGLTLMDFEPPQTGPCSPPSSAGVQTGSSTSPIASSRTDDPYAALGPVKEFRDARVAEGNGRSNLSRHEIAKKRVEASASIPTHPQVQNSLNRRPAMQNTSLMASRHAVPQEETALRSRTRLHKTTQAYPENNTRRGPRR